MVVSAWEDRCHQLERQGGRAEGLPRQRPALMHSNLKDVQHVQEVAK